MIVYGSKMYGRKDLVKGWGACQSCGQYGQQKSYYGRKWGHLYFIPLIPLGAKVRVLKECAKCSNGLHIPEKDVPDMLQNLRSISDAALAALIGGQKEFNHKGEDLPCAKELSGCIEFFYCLLAEDYIRLVLAALLEKKLDYVHHLVNGRSLEFQGKLDDAGASYRNAMEFEPEDILPISSLGAVTINKGDFQGARAIYERTLELTEDKLPIYQILLSVYESLKLHVELADTYEACLELRPELRQDKKIMKAYKKACKKAGRQPDVK
jgi:tetratricopeptide (TPR) repeat protein